VYKKLNRVLSEKLSVLELFRQGGKLSWTLSFCEKTRQTAKRTAEQRFNAETSRGISSRCRLMEQPAALESVYPRRRHFAFLAQWLCSLGGLPPRPPCARSGKSSCIEGGWVAAPAVARHPGSLGSRRSAVLAAAGAGGSASMPRKSLAGRSWTAAAVLPRRAAETAASLPPVRNPFGGQKCSRHPRKSRLISV
jgi:hypothetical protein